MTSRKTRLAALTGLLAVVATACGDSSQPLNTFDPRGPEARQLDDLIAPVFWVAGVFFVLVNVLIVVAVVKFRRRSDDEAPRQVHGNAKLELGWTIVPAVILAVIGVATLGTIADINAEPAPDALKVRVIGHQWWWEYRYEDSGIITANELHIPVGRTVAIDLEAADVVHSFWPPKLSGKVDAIPGRTNFMTVEATEPGIYYGQCAEFCGFSHAHMLLRVVAHQPADFQRWVAANQARPADVATLTGDAAAGAGLFRTKGCASCHAIDGFAAGEFGPNLTHLMQRDTFAGAMFEMNDRNLRRWLRDPPAEKPGSLMPNLELTEDEITKLIAYLNTLR